MEIYPAVDLYEGKVVRLERGDYEKRKIYSTDPYATAKRWAQEGARWLHVVDLEGARAGEIKNGEALEKILAEKRVSVQFGGGVRQKEDVDRLLRLGVKRVILGTKVLEPSFLQEVSKAYGERIALSLDLRGEEVQVEGWLRGGGKSVFDLFRELRGIRVACVIITDIERDGTLRGLDLPKWVCILEESPFPVICSGGVSSLKDLDALILAQDQAGGGQLKGVIIGKALYEESIPLKEALRLVQGRGPDHE